MTYILDNPRFLVCLRTVTEPPLNCRNTRSSSSVYQTPSHLADSTPSGSNPNWVGILSPTRTDTTTDEVWEQVRRLS
jgi:hypothetical protein